MDIYRVARKSCTFCNLIFIPRNSRNILAKKSFVLSWTVPNTWCVENVQLFLRPPCIRTDKPENFQLLQKNLGFGISFRYHINISLLFSNAYQWLSSRVVSVLDSCAEGPGFKSQLRCCRLTVLGKLLSVHTHRASVHQAPKLVAVLLRAARVSAGLLESNGSLLPGLWLTSPAGWLPRAEISSETLRLAVEYGLPLPFYLFQWLDTQGNTLGVER